MLDPQTTFNTALAHLRTQGRKAYNDETERCYYRYPDNPAVQCAVGCLIPDETYHDRIENIAASSAVVFNLVPGADENDASFLVNLQNQLHDSLDAGPSFTRQLEDAARRFARNHNLTYLVPIPETTDV